ncbi:MAG: hypothetical protein LPK45_07265 [Bacteroidota bacterium]|nr:hypothetical protein [Bacteroidota bacterium]MDX5430875.1 hypothetical protein [Bacteroidota bacterium]MDX5469620.1 hypothetical protein [Bacteroidota bacterium]
MKKNVTVWAFAALLAGVVGFSSCEKALKDASETADSAEDFANDQTAIAGMMDLVQDVSETQGFMGKNGNAILPEGVSINYIDTTYTDLDGIEIEIDLGQGVECADGWKRSGKFKIYSNEKKYSEIGAKVWIGKDNSSISMTKSSNFVDSSYTLTFGSADHLTLERVETEKLSATYQFVLNFKAGSNSFSYTPTGTYSVLRTEGGNTPGIQDDVYEISGSSTGENHNGTNYTMSITSPLVRKVDETCSKTFIKGGVELKNEGSSTSLKVDFGDGSCDNDIQITLPGGIKKTYTVK